MTGGEIAITASIAFLSISAPATAAIFARGRSGKPVDLNGKYVQTREYDAFKADLKDRLDGLDRKVDGLFDYVKSRL